MPEISDASITSYVNIQTKISQHIYSSLVIFHHIASTFINMSPQTQTNLERAVDLEMEWLMSRSEVL